MPQPTVGRDSGAGPVPGVRANGAIRENEGDVGRGPVGASPAAPARGEGLTEAGSEMQAAIVFDMDGVLVDTEPLKARAHRRAVEDRGGELTAELYRRQMGNPHGGVIRAFLEGAGLDASDAAAEAYERTFRRAYRRLLLEEVSPTEGALELLEACRREDRPLALVTSSDRWMVEIVLSHLGADGLFEGTVAADDVEAEKPDPSPYRRAREALGPAERRAVAVEDTEAGVASATGAGLPTVAVRHAFNGDHDFGEAAAVLESLTPTEKVLTLVERLAGDDPRRR